MYSSVSGLFLLVQMIQRRTQSKLEPRDQHIYMEKERIVDKPVA